MTTERDKPKAQTPPNPQSRQSRFDFVKGRGKVPDDFDTMCQAEIEEMFHGNPIEPPTDDESPATVEPSHTP